MAVIAPTLNPVAELVELLGELRIDGIGDGEGGADANEPGQQHDCTTAIHHRGAPLRRLR